MPGLVVWEAVSGLHELAPGEADVYLVQVRREAKSRRFAKGELDLLRRLLEARRAEVVSPSAAQLVEGRGRGCEGYVHPMERTRTRDCSVKPIWRWLVPPLIGVSHEICMPRLLTQYFPNLGAGQ